MVTKFRKIKKCPQCSGKVRTYTNVKDCVFLSYCTDCQWVDSRQMFDNLYGGVDVCDTEDAIDAGYLKQCPVTKQYVPSWMIHEHGMSIEAWHKKNKSTLTK